MAFNPRHAARTRTALRPPAGGPPLITPPWRAAELRGVRRLALLVACAAILLTLFGCRRSRPELQPAEASELQRSKWALASLRPSKDPSVQISIEAAAVAPSSRWFLLRIRTTNTSEEPLLVHVRVLADFEPIDIGAQVFLNKRDEINRMLANAVGGELAPRESIVRKVVVMLPVVSQSMLAGEAKVRLEVGFQGLGCVFESQKESAPRVWKSWLVTDSRRIAVVANIGA